MNTPLDDGGPVASIMTLGDKGEVVPVGGLSIRDYFARAVPHDEVSEMTYKHLSHLAQQRLAGMPYPEENRDARGEAAVNYQIAVMQFHARVNAALRYISADAMLAARKEKP